MTISDVDVANLTHLRTLRQVRFSVANQRPQQVE